MQIVPGYIRRQVIRCASFFLFSCIWNKISYRFLIFICLVLAFILFDAGERIHDLKKKKQKCMVYIFWTIWSLPFVLEFLSQSLLIGYHDGESFLILFKNCQIPKCCKTYLSIFGARNDPFNHLLNDDDFDSLVIFV